MEPRLIPEVLDSNRTRQLSPYHYYISELEGSVQTQDADIFTLHDLIEVPDCSKCNNAYIVQALLLTQERGPCCVFDAWQCARKAKPFGRYITFAKAYNDTVLCTIPSTKCDSGIETVSSLGRVCCAF